MYLAQYLDICCLPQPGHVVSVTPCVHLQFIFESFLLGDEDGGTLETTVILKKTGTPIIRGKLKVNDCVFVFVCVHVFVC